MVTRDFFFEGGIFFRSVSFSKQMRSLSITKSETNCFETMTDVIDLTNAANDTPAPPGVEATLYQHQHEGVAWMMERECDPLHAKGGVLADEPGLGKTLQMLSLIAARPGDAPTLVISPKSLVDMWKQQTRAFYPSCGVHILTKKDTNALNSRALESMGHCILITTYGTVRNNLTLAATRFHRIILDEAHAIKNASSKISNACFQLKAAHKWVLTGTPITKDSNDFKSLLRFIGEETTHVHGRFVMTWENLIRLKRLYVLRRTFDDVGARDERMRLPPLHIINHEVDLSRDEKIIYNNLVRYGRFSTHVAEQQLLSGENRQEATRNIFEILLRMNQVVFSPELIRDKLEQLRETFFVVDMNLDDIASKQNDNPCAICLEENIQDICMTPCGHFFCKGCFSMALQVKKMCPMCRTTVEPGTVKIASAEEGEVQGEIVLERSTKMRKINEILHSNSRKTLIFCHWKNEMGLIAEMIRSEFSESSVFCIDGSTKARQEICDAFNACEGHAVLILQINVGATGLNLQSASQVIFGSLDWSAANETQAIARSHRLGQVSDVLVHRICGIDTIDHHIIRLQQTKLNTASIILGDSKIRSKLGVHQINNFYRLFKMIPL